MELYRKRDIYRSGIYLIRNKITDKTYIGRSVNIYKRILHHKFTLRNKTKDANFHLCKAWYKYGEDNFEYVVLEDVEKNNEKLNQRELFWMTKYKSTNRKFGYNLKFKTKGGTLPEETRKRMSDSMIKRVAELNYDTSKHSHTFWKDNPKKLKEMGIKLKLIKRKYRFEQYSRDMIFIKVWDSVEDIILNNKGWKWQNIYSVCNGYKPTYMNFIWRKIKI